MVTETENNKVKISTHYSKRSTASGALFSFVFLTEDGGVDFNRSVLLALDRSTSLNYTLPFNLHPGHYRVYVYDIEQDGTLSNGVLYPAVRNDLEITGNGLGKALSIMRLKELQLITFRNTNSATSVHCEIILSCH